MNKARIKALLAEYGNVALYTYIALFAVSMLVFGSAIAFGFDVEGVGQNAGVLAGAWLGTKLIQPLRIIATVVLTPLIARILRRRGTPAIPRKLKGSPPDGRDKKDVTKHDPSASEARK